MSTVPAATRTLRLLRLLATRAEPVPAAVIDHELRLPRSSVYQLLDATTKEDVVVRFPEERRWGLGAAAEEIGSAALRHAPLKWLARPCSPASPRAHATAHLGVLRGGDIPRPAQGAAAPRSPSSPGATFSCPPT